MESRRAKLNDKQRTVKREKTRGKAEINSHKDVFSRGQEFWEEMIRGTRGFGEPRDSKFVNKMQCWYQTLSPKPR